MVPTVASSRPVTVTGCATFQVAAVNCRAAGAAAPSNGLSLSRVTVTAPSGWDLSATLYMTLVPGAVAHAVALGVNAMPTTSSLMLVSGTVLAAGAAYLASALAAVVFKLTVYALLVSAMSSLTPVTV